MRTLKWAVFISGASAVVAQILLIREGLALFGGYELISGILLCFWLIWGGLGSLFFSWLGFRRHPRTIYAILLFVFSACILYSITFMRYAPRIFTLPFGEVVSPVTVVLVSLLALAPTCCVVGALFPAASRVLEPEKVFLLEGIGSFFGGIAMSFVLIQIVPPYGVVVIILCVLTACAFLLLKMRVLIFLSCMLALLLTQVSSIEHVLRNVQLGGQTIVGLRESRYGVIAVTRTHTQLNFYTNGVYDFSYPDVYTNEEAVHYALLLHEVPKKVLLIGGGVGNCLEQIAKHATVEGITYIELDPLLVSMGEKYIGPLQHNEHIQVVFGDARFFIKNTHEKYDVIILNIPDPVNGQLNRFYTREFFREVKKILHERGLLSLRITSPPDIISPLFGQLLATVQKTVRSSFRHVVVLPAARTTFIATEYPLPLEDIPVILKQRIQDRNLSLVYVNDYFIDYNLTAEKLNYVRQRLDESQAFLNTDVKPICYYFTTIVWSGISEGLRNFFITLFHINPLVFLVPLLVVIFFFRRRSIVYLSVFSVGASSISAEVVLIILFQVMYGYLYGWIGAIIAFYMLGLALGTFIYLRFSFLRGNLFVFLSNLEFAIVVYCILIAMLSLFMLPVARTVIPVLMLCGGFLGGMHFPLSVKVMTRGKAPAVYSVDLLGASLGALLTSVIFIPILGIIYTLIFLIVLNLLVAIGLRTIRGKS